jgi:tetratricopeptide (TPR) repeat protein
MEGARIMAIEQSSENVPIRKLRHPRHLDRPRGPAMRNLSTLPRVLTGLATLALVTASAHAADIPIEVLQNWNIYNNAGWIFLNRGQYDKAEDRFRRAISEIRPYAKEDQRLLARSYADLARVFYHQGRYADAEPLARWALTVRESNPRVSADAVFQSLYTLALIHVAQEHFNQAEPLLRRALELQEKEIGPNHIHTAATLDELAGVCAEQRKFHEAEILYRRAISIYQRFNPEENPDLAGCAERYAAMLERIDRRADAEKFREQAKKIRDAVESKTARSRDSRPRPEFRGFR